MLKAILFLKGQHSTAATLLITLGVGYFVLCFARKEEKLLKKIGYIIGVTIVSISCLMMLGKSVFKAYTILNQGSESVLSLEKS